MPKIVSKIYRMFVIQWQTMIQYRADLLLWTLADAVSPLVALVIWYNVAASAHSPYNQDQIITYYIFIIFTKLLTQAWGGYFLAQEILNGDVIKFLVRPFSVFWNYIANNIVEKFLKFFLPLATVVLVLFFNHGFLVPEIYQATNIALFILSLLIATALNFMIDMSLGLAAFWLEDAQELRRFQYLLEELSSGALIPFAMMPAYAATLFSWLPFRYVIAAPVELLMGRVVGVGAWQLIGLQLVWTGVLAIILITLWQKGLRRYAVPGQ